MTRDVDQSRVYDAESFAFDGTTLASQLGVRHFEQLVELVTSSDWWQRTATHRTVNVAAARADAHRSAFYLATSTIRVAGSQWTIACLLHELGHAHAPRAAHHNSTFRASYVEVTRLVAGDDVAQQLEHAFVSRGLHLAADVERAPGDRPLLNIVFPAALDNSSPTHRHRGTVDRFATHRTSSGAIAL
jgi:hypothetical protein